MTTTSTHAGHAHCSRCNVCQSFAPGERELCGDCHAAANCGEPDYSASNAAFLGRTHAARALAYGPIHRELARPLALGRWEQAGNAAEDEVTAARLKRFYVDAFVAEIEAAFK